jgi:hypothetical protein
MYTAISIRAKEFSSWDLAETLLGLALMKATKSFILPGSSLEASIIQNWKLIGPSRAPNILIAVGILEQQQLAKTELIRGIKETSLLKNRILCFTLMNIISKWIDRMSSSAIRRAIHAISVIYLPRSLYRDRSLFHSELNGYVSDVIPITMSYELYIECHIKSRQYYQSTASSNIYNKRKGIQRLNSSFLLSNFIFTVILLLVRDGAEGSTDSVNLAILDKFVVDISKLDISEKASYSNMFLKLLRKHGFTFNILKKHPESLAEIEYLIFHLFGPYENDFSGLVIETLQDRISSYADIIWLLIELKFTWTDLREDVRDMIHRHTAQLATLLRHNKDLLLYGRSSSLSSVHTPPSRTAKPNIHQNGL